LKIAQNAVTLLPKKNLSIKINTADYPVRIFHFSFSYLDLLQGSEQKKFTFEETGLKFKNKYFGAEHFLGSFGIFEQKKDEKGEYFFLDYYKIGKIIFYSSFFDEDTKIRYYNILIFDQNKK
jgi:hypothetical protein